MERYENPPELWNNTPQTVEFGDGRARQLSREKPLVYRQGLLPSRLCARRPGWAAFLLEHIAAFSRTYSPTARAWGW
jgi:hypothetical protein